MFTLLWEPCGRCVCITLKCTGGCCRDLLPASRRVFFFIHSYRRLFSLQLAEPSALLKKSTLGWRGTYHLTNLSFAPHTHTRHSSALLGSRPEPEDAAMVTSIYLCEPSCGVQRRLSVRCWRRAPPPALAVVPGFKEGGKDGRVTEMEPRLKAWGN